MDLHTVFQIDDLDEILDRRTWHWLLARCERLFTHPLARTRLEAFRGV